MSASTCLLESTHPDRRTTCRETLKVPLWGVNAPERKQPRAEEAREFLRGKLDGKAVEVDVVSRDRHKRLLARISVRRPVPQRRIAEGRLGVVVRPLCAACQRICRRRARPRQRARGLDGLRRHGAVGVAAAADGRESPRLGIRILRGSEEEEVGLPLRLSNQP